MVRSRKRSNSRKPAFQFLEPEPSHFLPFEFCILGKPISHQTKDRAALNAWKEHAASVARELWQGDPVGDYLKMTGIHFFDCQDGNMSGVPDNNNIMKPLQDSFQDIIYVNDFQITDFTMKRRDLNGSFRVKGITPPVAWALCQNCEFVHMLIELVTDHESLY